MIHLLGLVLVSPISVVMISAASNLFPAFIVSDCDECGFNDLGKLLFGGLAAAILLGIAVSVIVRRRKDSHSHTSDFVSIRETDRKR
jgi:hypothetical protein